MTHKLLFLFALISLCWSACSEPTPFGADLLEDQVAQLEFTDTLSLQFTLEREDSLLTSDRSSIASYFICGRLNDPFFGVSKANVYTLFQLSALSPDFSNADLDSIVLFLGYDANGVYGDTLTPQTLHVNRLAEVIQNSKGYYSTNAIPAAEEIGTLNNFMPRPRTSVNLFDTITKGAYVRVPLSNALGQDILKLDSATLANDSTFYAFVRGLRITAEPASDPGAMLAFDLNDSKFSFIRLYYTQNDTSKRTFDLRFRGTNKFVQYEHDYSGKPVEALIGKPVNELLYLQGITGLRLKMHVPFANALKNVAINKAELLLTVAEQPGDFLSLAPASQLVMTKKSTDTTLAFISDVAYASNLGALRSFFGGFPNNELVGGVTVKQYKMTMSSHFQDMIVDPTTSLEERTVFINVFTQNGSAMRSILYGVNHPLYPAKLSIKYTFLP
jgi:hypothetical protein